MNLSNYRLPYPHEITNRSEWPVYTKYMEKYAGLPVPGNAPLWNARGSTLAEVFNYNWKVAWLVPTYKDTFEMINKYYGL